MGKKRILYFIIGCMLIIFMSLVARSVWSDIVAKNNALRLSQASVETRQVELDKLNCKYTLNEENLKITIEKYKGAVDCVIIPKEINGYEIEKIKADAFIDCYNLETIQIAKELKDIIQDIEEFEINDKSENKEYIELKTTRTYSDAYDGYIKLSEQEKAEQEVIPKKFSVPSSKIYSEEMEQNYEISKLEEAGMPAKYDLRDYIDIKVENQGSYGICYAYSALSAIETNLSLRKGETIDLSEIHYATVSGQGYGGWFIEASDNYYASLIGPVYETDWAKADISGNNSNEDYKIINQFLGNKAAIIDKERLEEIQEKMKKTSAVKYVTETMDIPSITKAMKEDDTKKEEVSKIRNIIKKHLIEYGSLDSYISMEEVSYNGKVVLNHQGAVDSAHAVNIVGWDDNFSKENFPANIRPKNDGAYLALNSWGESFGEKGYFWISYEDRYVETGLNGVISVEEIPGNISFNSMTVKDIETNQALNNAYIGRGQNIEILLDIKVNNVLEDNNVDVKIRNAKEEFAKDIVISGKEIVNNAVNLKIKMNTREYEKGSYIIDIIYGEETISKQIEIVSNTFDYTVNEDGKSITITKYNGENTKIEIPKEYLGYKVTKIGNNAFNQKNLESIIIYENVQEIGTSIISRGVTIYGYKGTPIEEYALNNNYTFLLIGQEIIEGSYWKFDITNNILYITDVMEEYKASKEVPWYNFSKSIYKIKFETDNINTIPNYAFYNCSNVNDITIPNNISKIGKYAFYNCSNLTQIELNNNITEIGEYTFYGCSNLNDIKVPENVTKIEISTFAYCDKLTKIKLSDKTTKIAANAFNRCSNLKEIEIPKSVTEIGASAFSYCSKLAKIELPDNLNIVNSYMFEACKDLKEVKLPNTIKTISNGAFRNCSSLESIDLPDEVLLIQNSAFSGCISLKSIEIPEKVEEIASYAFQNCKNLSNVTLPDGLTKIGEYAFSSCSSLTNIELPMGTTSIGNYTFSSCSSLTNIELPTNITSIGNYAFRECTSLQSINLPTKITSIGDYAFQNCKKLKEINLPDGLTKIGKELLKGCSSLKKIEIPLNVEVIGESAFAECTNLTTINLPEKITSIEKNTFYNCKRLADIEIPSHVQKIGESAFENCEKLNSINVPETVKEIGNKAFSGCKEVKSIHIPNSVIIGEAAFEGVKLSVTAEFKAGKTETEMGIPEILKRIMDAKDILYASENVTINGCEIVENAIKINAKNFGTITINDGKMKGFVINIKKSFERLTKLEIKKEPNKIVYKEGENFDPEGMIVEAVYADGTRIVVTDYTIIFGENLEPSQTSVTVRYKDEISSIITTVSQKITVEKVEENKQDTNTNTNTNTNIDTNKDTNTTASNTTNTSTDTNKNTSNNTNKQTVQTNVESNKESSIVLASINIKTKPNKVDYIEGEKFDKAGMVITANYSNGKSKTITSYTYTPKEALQKTDTKITISYTEGGVTKKVSQKITVRSENEADNNISTEDSANTENTEEQPVNKGVIVLIVLVAGAAIGGLIYYYYKSNN